MTRHHRGTAAGKSRRSVGRMRSSHFRSAPMITTSRAAYAGVSSFARAQKRTASLAESSARFQSSSIRSAVSGSIPRRYFRRPAPEWGFSTSAAAGNHYCCVLPIEAIVVFANATTRAGSLANTNRSAKSWPGPTAYSSVFFMSSALDVSFGTIA